MSTWSDLQREIEAWETADQTLTMWWRDDDAATTTPALDKLLNITTFHDVPVALAAIPAHATPDLAKALEQHPNTTILQHGFSHTSHATTGEKKTELGDHRPIEQVLSELSDGRAILQQLFRNPPPVLVPPWNRISPDVSRALPGIGISGLSTFGARARSTTGLTVANTHADIIDWRGTREFAGVEHTLRQLVAHLAARRANTVDPVETTGLLTHHLVHDDDCWQFLDDLFTLTARHPVVEWLGADEIFNMSRQAEIR